jgi:hypothetical protein
MAGVRNRSEDLWGLAGEPALEKISRNRGSPNAPRADQPAAPGLLPRIFAERTRFPATAASAGGIPHFLAISSPGTRGGRGCRASPRSADSTIDTNERWREERMRDRPERAQVKFPVTTAPVGSPSECSTGRSRAVMFPGRSCTWTGTGPWRVLELTRKSPVRRLRSPRAPPTRSAMRSVLRPLPQDGGRGVPTSPPDARRDSRSLSRRNGSPTRRCRPTARSRR